MARWGGAKDVALCVPKRRLGEGGGWAAGQGGEEDAALRGLERGTSGNMDET